MTKLSEQNNSGTDSKELSSNLLITGPKAILAAGILAVATTSLADTTKLKVKSLIEQCDFNEDGKVTTKKTWKTDGVSKKIAKKENSCKIDYENDIIKLRIAEKDKRIAEKDKRIAEKDKRIAEGRKEVAEGRKEVAEGRKEVAELDKKYITLLAELSEKDLLRLIKETQKEIESEKNPLKLKSLRKVLKRIEEQYNQRINQKTA